jgi:hypothetical protein
MKRIHVYVKDEEYTECKQIAESSGRSLSEFVREIVFESLRVVPLLEGLKSLKGRWWGIIRT